MLPIDKRRHTPSHVGEGKDRRELAGWNDKTAVIDIVAAQDCEGEYDRLQHFHENCTASVGA